MIYAAIQEFGGIIEAKTGPYLVFEIDGRIFKKQSVTIPAQPYMRPAFDENKDQAIQEITDSLYQAIMQAVA